MISIIIPAYCGHRIAPGYDKLIIDTLMVHRFWTLYIKLHEIQSKKDVLLLQLNSIVRRAVLEMKAHLN